MRNSVLEELRVRRLASRRKSVTEQSGGGRYESKLRGWKEKKVEYHLSEETRVLSGVVYMTKSRGPRTEP